MIDVINYSKEKRSIWDEFIDIKSMNGTFLQSMAFLEYHKEGKFDDASLLIGNNTRDIYAIVPACTVFERKQKQFYSHLGSTFGGPVISKDRYNIKDITSIIESIEEFLVSENYEKVYFKITPDIFSVEKSDLLQYLLSLLGYTQLYELSSYIDFSNYDEDILANFTKERRYDYKKCLNSNMEFFQLTDAKIPDFYGLLVQNLQKYNTKPVHTVEDLYDLQKRLPGIINFFGVQRENELLAAGMTFTFRKTNTLHVQYLAASKTMPALSPMTFLNYNLINYAKVNGFSKLSWGISTEKKGKILNVGLAQVKESYGSMFTINRTFFKDLGK